MSHLIVKQLNALWVLGWALVKHLLLWSFVRRPGPGPWLQRMAQESLGPVPPFAWQILGGTSRCVGCHLCDVIGERDDTPSLWMASTARQPADAVLALYAADRLEILAPAIRRICPAQVPVLAVVELIRENHRMLVAR